MLAVISRFLSFKLIIIVILAAIFSYQMIFNEGYLQYALTYNDLAKVKLVILVGAVWVTMTASITYLVNEFILIFTAKKFINVITLVISAILALAAYYYFNKVNQSVADYLRDYQDINIYNLSDGLFILVWLFSLFFFCSVIHIILSRILLIIKVISRR